MGNNGSQSGNISRRGPVETEQWAHSFPRSPPRMYHHGGAKVLPERDSHMQLRPTNNGEILQSGGTLSGRHHQHGVHLDKDDLDASPFQRSNSISSLHPQEYRQRSDSPPLRSYLAHQRDPLHRNMGRYGDQKPSSNGCYNSNLQKEKMKRFGSEPDLRDPMSMNSDIDIGHRNNKKDRSRGRKKYKAPPPPPCGGMMLPGMEHSLSESSNWERTSNGESDKRYSNNINNNRKARLFKTRTEMKKKLSPNMKRRSIAEDSRSAKSTEFDKKYNNKNLNRDVNMSKDIQRNNRLSLPDMKVTSTPEFQAELREATKRLRSIKTIDTKLKNHDANKQQRNENVINFGGRDNRAARDKLKTLDHNINLKYKIKQAEQQKLQSMERESTKLSMSIENVRGPASGKDSTPEQSPSRKPLQEKEFKDNQPAKTFYFGMDNHHNQHTPLNSTDHVSNNNLMNQQYPSAHKIQPYNNSSVSDLSSEPDIDDCPVSRNGIALQLRPILPKKQLEIPRFSPAAAWRLLSAMESNAPPSTVASDEGPMLIEDRIEKLSRPPPPPTLQPGPRSNHDKSGDSGISGDAGPTGYEDSPDAIVLNSQNNNVFQNASSRPPVVMSWTPQQDLEGEEESSLEDDANGRNVNNPMNFSPRSHVFSLSLPRDNHLAQYIGDKAKTNSGQQFSSNLQKIKRSVSGVLGNLTPMKSKDSGGQMLNVSSTQDQSDNWFLSRSAPNSLNNGFNSLELKPTHHQHQLESDPLLDSSAPLVPLVNNTNGRLMYLPNCDNDAGNSDSGPRINGCGGYRKQERSKSRDESYGRAQLINRGLRKSKMSYSKSCENISSQANLPNEPENLQDPPNIENDDHQWKIRKPKRFTFQSTVRQIERRRLADKLSKEAERKEQQRLGELEAMQRVEEEFQRKRAREKASIRQQLRLFSMDDTSWSSLPPNWEANDTVPSRPEPDGAVSSSASSSTFDQLTPDTKKPSTKYVKSSNKTDSPKMEEYKKKMLKNGASSSSSAKKFSGSKNGSSESSEENRIKAPTTQVLSEFREMRREYLDYRGSSRLSDHAEKQTVVHPQVTCNMPKAHQGSSNLEGNSSKINNYRRDFAHGVNPSKLEEVAGRYSDDSQSQSPRIQARKPRGK